MSELNNTIPVDGAPKPEDPQLEGEINNMLKYQKTN